MSLHPKTKHSKFDNTQARCELGFAIEYYRKYRELHQGRVRGTNRDQPQ